MSTNRRSHHACLRSIIAAVVTVGYVGAAHAQPPGYAPQAAPQPVQQPGYAPQPVQQPGYAPQPFAPPQQVYVVQQTDPSQAAALQARLYELRVLRSQHRVGGPIAMIAVGSGIAAISALIAMSFALSRAGAGDTGPLGTDLRRGVRVSSFIALGGVVMIVIGGIRLSRNLRLRRQYDPEIRQIREQLRMLQPTLAVRAGPNDLGLQLRMSF